MYKIKSLYILVFSALFFTMLISCSGERVKNDQNPLKGTQWNLLFYRKSTIMEGTQITLSFDGDQLGGSSGCNSFSGTYQVDGNIIQVGELAATMMACMEPEGVMDQESYFLEFLGNAQRFELTDGRLMIFRSDGEALTFEPLA